MFIVPLDLIIIKNEIKVEYLPKYVAWNLPNWRIFAQVVQASTFIQLV